MPNMEQTMKAKNNVVPVHFDADFFYERAIRSFKRYELDKAYKYFRRCVDLDRSNIHYKLHLSTVLTEMGQYERSNELLFNMLDEWGLEAIDCHYFIANNLAHLGDLEAAERHILIYLQHAPDGDYREEAEEILDYICYELKRAPTDLNEDHLLIEEHEKARHCLEQGKFLEATRLLEDLIERFPDFLAARNNLALAYYYLGLFDRALDVIDDILSRDPANLHALCNLAIFYSHAGDDDQVRPLMTGLKKVQPLQVDHHYKLATTLGILGEDERALELFHLLAKRGMHTDVSLYHYLAVASFNTGRWAEAENYWLKVKEMDPETGVADYYLDLLTCKDIRQGNRRLPYHYQLPYDVQWRQGKNWFEEGDIPTELLNDPLVRSTLFWTLRHGNQDSKLQVIQSFQFLADEEVETALRQLLKDQNEDDYVKKVAVFVLRQIGAEPPYEAYLNGEWVTVDSRYVDDKVPLWITHWQKVIYCLQEHMEGHYDLVEHQQAQTIWTKFLRISYPKLPQIRKTEAWAAAVECLIAQNGQHQFSKKEIASKYGISVSALSRNVELIEKTILMESMNVTRKEQSRRGT